ncbi:MAG TPA: hypothetical protein GX526_05320 [Thermoanaerobacterales bacterium]|nr:hypothetical protein [Thermoanaerobacterales bacterium]
MIFRINNLKIRFNILFILILIFAFIIGVEKEIFIVFFAVFIHEGAHCIVGEIIGYKVSEIELTPYGGAAKFEGLIGAPPLDDIIISISGPLINIIIAICCVILDLEGLIGSDLFIFFIKTNLYLAGFNLIPVLPLDGGRIMRAILSIFTGYRKATEVGILSGKILAIIMFFFGIYIIFLGSLNITPIIVSLFIFWSLKNEEQYFIYAYINSISKKTKILKQKGTLNHYSLIIFKETPLKNVIKRFVPNKYCTIKIINEKGEILGELTEKEVIRGLLDKGIWTKIEDLLVK